MGPGLVQCCYNAEQDEKMIAAKVTICRPKPQANRQAVTLDGGILPFALRLTRQPTLGNSDFFTTFTRPLIPKHADQRAAELAVLKYLRCQITIAVSLVSVIFPSFPFCALSP